MDQRIGRLKTMLARHRERREQRRSKRMALGLAVVLGVATALPFAYWHFQMHEVVGSVQTTEELAAKCDQLAATLAKVQKEAGRTIGASKDDLDYRISECDEMGVDVTTGSINANVGDEEE